MKRPLVYVAGPLGDPDIIGWDAVMANKRRAQDAGMQLVHAGWSPIVPHQNADWPNAFEVPHATWLEVDESLVLACEALVRLEGASKGADREVVIAQEDGIPVLTLEEAMTGPHLTMTSQSDTVVHLRRLLLNAHAREEKLKKVVRAIKMGSHGMDKETFEAIDSICKLLSQGPEEQRVKLA